MEYTDPLAWSGQFAHCALPLRLDSYRGCGFSCSYCFARTRGGNLPDRRIVPASPNSIRQQFRLADQGSPSVIAQALRRRVPVHFGGMSDPFQPAELRHRATLSFLRDLSARRYPTIISTKGDLATLPEYLAELTANPHLIVQVSLVSILDSEARKIEPNATAPSRLLRMMEQLSRVGVVVTCRLQPFITEIAGNIRNYVSTVTSVGARQISVEHLKVPVERTSNPIVEDQRIRYKKSGASRDGREHILPPDLKKSSLLLTREECHRASITFGCADNEFQYLSDSWACCSGADIFPGFENFYRYQIGFALRKSRGREITLAEINDEWRPVGSVDRYLNSKTRLSRRGILGTIDEHIKYRWNSSTAPGSPLSFAGVHATDRFSHDGNRIYVWSAEQ